MDAIAGLLDGPRARRAFLLRCALRPPWALHIEDESPLALVAILRGEAALRFETGSETVTLRAGDVAIVRGPEHYRFGDTAGTPPQAIIGPGQRCTTPDGRAVEEMRVRGVRRWGNSDAPSTEALVGAYGVDGEVPRRLLDVLPRVLVVGPGELGSSLPALLAEEMGRERVGQEAVLDRLLDLVLIDALRAHFASRALDDGPGWLRAQRDPVVDHAVRLLQDNPAEPWTLATLARATSVSRATLARRFADVVGQPPMAFLAEWRLTLAADLLLAPGETIASVAQRVGYGSPYALSTAFRRVRGLSPAAHRRAQRPRVAAA